METLAQSRSGTASILAAAPTQPVPRAVRMAYLLSRYPAISHTFFLHEVLGLRARGLHIETASINPPDRPPAALPPLEAAEAEATYYLKGGSRIHTLGTLLTTILLFPGAVFRGLATVLRLPALPLRRRLFWFFYLAEALLVGRWMKTRNLQHLHIHFGGPVASVGMLAGLAFRIPYSLTIHGPEELLNHDAYHLPQKITAAAFIFCISDFCRSQLYTLVPPDQWSKFQVLRLGVDPLVLTPPSRTAAPCDICELVCTGRLVPEKGHHILLQALVLLRERGTTVNVTFIGAGPELTRLQDFAAQHRLTASITFTGALSHPATLTLLRRADLFALASFAEGIPVALMEAMSLGLPCISTSIAGIPELIRTGIDGLLVPPPTPSPSPTHSSLSSTTRASAAPSAPSPASASSAATTYRSIRSSSPQPSLTISRSSPNERTL